MTPKPTSTLLAVFLVLGSMTSVCLGASVAKKLFAIGGPSGTTAVRITIGAALLVAFWRPWRFQLSREQFFSIFLYGACLGSMNLLFYYAISKLPIGLAIAIEFLGPLSVALFYSRKKLDLLWVFFAAVGIVLIVPLNNLATSLVDPVGVAFALGAAVMWACYILIGKRASKLSHPGSVTAVGMVIGALIVFPFGFSSALALLSNGSLIFKAVAMGLLSSAIPYSLEIVALKKLNENHFGLLMSLEPAIGSLIAFFFLSETLSPQQLIAIAAIMVASIGSTYSRRSPIHLEQP